MSERGDRRFGRRVRRLGTGDSRTISLGSGTLLARLAPRDDQPRWESYARVQGRPTETQPIPTRWNAAGASVARSAPCGAAILDRTHRRRPDTGGGIHAVPRVPRRVVRGVDPLEHGRVRQRAVRSVSIRSADADRIARSDLPLDLRPRLAEPADGEGPLTGRRGVRGVHRQASRAPRSPPG